MERMLIEPVKYKPKKTRGKEPFYEDVATAESGLLTEDLAVFFLVHYIVLTEIETVKEVKEYFSFLPEMLALVDSVLIRMEELEIISIDGDAITYNQHVFDCGGDPKELKCFLPNLFRIATKRVLKDAEVDTNLLRRKKKEMVRFYVLPDSPELAQEISDLTREYKEKLLRITRRASSGKGAIRMRFVGTVNVVMEPEDFV